MNRIDVGVEIADRQSLDFVYVDQTLNFRNHLSLVEGRHHCASSVDSFGDPDPETTGSEKAGALRLCAKVIEPGTLHAAQLQCVAVPPCGQQPDARALALQQGVGGNRGSVDMDDLDAVLVGIDAALVEHHAYPVDDPLHDVGGGRGFRVVHGPVDVTCYVREGPADIDSDSMHLNVSTLVLLCVRSGQCPGPRVRQRLAKRIFVHGSV